MFFLFEEFSYSCFPIMLFLTTRNGINNEQQFEAGRVLHVYCIVLIMQTSDQEIIPKKSLKARIMKWLGLTNEVTIKLYHGYGHVEQMSIHGHIFKLSPLPRRKYRKSFIHNTWA